MEKQKRSTVFGAALIFMVVWFATQLGACTPRHEDTQINRLPQGGLSKPGQGTAVPAGPGAAGVTFSASDAKKAAIRYADDCAYRVDVAHLVTARLDWDLSVREPTVLIVHTHASESYTKTADQDYAESTSYRTLDTAYNMVALGDRLAELLREAGITVLHDRRLHDYPSYNSAYNNSRLSVQEYLAQFPSVCVVLDLHRDAVALADGSQYAPTVQLAGASVAQVMMVVGSDGSGMEHPDWRENLAAALKLQVLLEKAAPGITRPTILRAQRFNHDLSDGAMIVEVGTAGNTFDEAMRAIPYLADALSALMHGAQ